MSHYFTTLRFNIADEKYIFPYEYISAGFEVFLKDRTLSQDDSWLPTENTTSPDPDTNLTNANRSGRRRFGEIRVETFMAQHIKDILNSGDVGVTSSKEKEIGKELEKEVENESVSVAVESEEEHVDQTTVKCSEEKTVVKEEEARKTDKTVDPTVNREKQEKTEEMIGKAKTERHEQGKELVRGKREERTGSQDDKEVASGVGEAAASGSLASKMSRKNRSLKGKEKVAGGEVATYSEIVSPRGQRSENTADNKKYTISGALKQPLVKARSLDQYGERAPAGTTEGAAAAVGSIKEPRSISFTCGNPAVEITEGILHLFKSDEPFPWDTEAAHAAASVTSKSQMLCILAVPATLTCRDLIQFFAPAEASIEHIKVIKDSNPNHYMVLLKFCSEATAIEFYQDYNGKRYNSLEEDVCHLVVVARVETVKSSEAGDRPIPGMTELPLCPVCLERMDESVSGVLTILCNHSFHTTCLIHWEDTTCPVCRYIQTPEQVAEHQCFQCSCPDNLWICLICGHVGCGRYAQGHAFQHFQTTNHTFAMQLGSRCVWDYASDNFVHRLVQNNSDGKMVQVGDTAEEVGEGGAAEGQDDEKMDSVTLEFTYMLTSQLEAQRVYFEEKIKHVELEALRQTESAEEKARQALEKSSKLEGELVSVHRDKQAIEKKQAQIISKLNKLQTELREEQEMNKSLQSNQGDWYGRVRDLEKEIQEKNKEVSDLQEQLRDIMFYMDAQQKLTQSADVTQDELEGSHVVMAEGKRGKGHRKRGK